MHWFFPGAFFFGPALLFFGFFKILLFLLLIMLIVRLVSHGHQRAAYAGGWGHGYGHRHGYEHDPQNFDPARIAAWRYAAGKIDRAEFDHIMSGLAAGTPAAPPASPAPPAPPVA